MLFAGSAVWTTRSTLARVQGGSASPEDDVWLIAAGADIRQPSCKALSNALWTTRSTSHLPFKHNAGYGVMFRMAERN